MFRSRYALIATVTLSILGLGIAFAQSSALADAAPKLTQMKKQLGALCAELAREQKLSRPARTNFMRECGGGGCSYCGGGTICDNRECFCECGGGTWTPSANGVCGYCGPPE